MSDPTPESLDALVRLVHRRWALPVLAELSASKGGKFITLVHRLDVSRETLRATLDDLIDAGWVMRNPGYGHPMRPEYLLTAEGLALAPPSSRLVQEVRRLKIETLAFKKWTLPVTLAIGEHERRFGELRAELPRVTPRALTLTLKDMQTSDLVERVVVDDYPPLTIYRLEPRAMRLWTALAPVARAV